MRLKRILISAASQGALCHAYIFEGAAGSGRHTAAMLTAMAAACRSERVPCLVCESCRKLKAGISPDFITVLPEGDRKTLGVDPIRELAETIYIAPNDLDVKFYLIPDADNMTPQAQNALLKMLEEPPSGVYFMLLCENSANLLPTVKSRAPILKLQKFSDEELSRLLLENEKNAVKLKAADKDTFERCIKLADGSVGEALRLLDARKSARTGSIYERVDTFFRLLASGSRAEFTAYAVSLSDKRDERAELVELLGLVAVGARDLLTYKYGVTTPRAFFVDAPAATALAAKFSAERLHTVACRADAARYDVQSNANITTALTALAAGLNK